MPVYRTPVFEDASGRMPGLQLRADHVVRAELAPDARIEDCGSFFRVATSKVSRPAGWRPASPADLRAPVRVVAPKVEVPKAVEKTIATPKIVEPEPEGAEPPKKRSRKKKD